MPFESQVPQILFMVCSRDGNKKHNAVGFGHFTLPRRAGMFDTEIPMWRYVLHMYCIVPHGMPKGFGSAWGS